VRVVREILLPDKVTTIPWGFQRNPPTILLIPSGGNEFPPETPNLYSCMFEPLAQTRMMIKKGFLREFSPLGVFHEGYESNPLMIYIKGGDNDAIRRQNWPLGSWPDDRARCRVLRWV
jgi:hypothetical protein